MTDLAKGIPNNTVVAPLAPPSVIPGRFLLYPSSS